MEKVKKTLSPEQLEKLKVAREKALSVRQANAKNKALEKELATAEKEQHLTEVKEKLAKVKIAKQEPPKIEIVESEPESEPEVIVRKKRNKKKKIIVVEDSDTDEEQQQVIFVKKKKDNPLQPIQRPAEQVPAQVFKAPPKVQEDPYDKHYNALFNPPRRF